MSDLPLAGRRPGGVRAGRLLLTDPALPVVVLGVAAVLAAFHSPVPPVLTWAITGGLAGYSLSGSV